MKNNNVIIIGKISKNQQITIGTDANDNIRIIGKMKATGVKVISECVIEQDEFEAIEIVDSLEDIVLVDSDYVAPADNSITEDWISDAGYEMMNFINRSSAQKKEDRRQMEYELLVKSIRDNRKARQAKRIRR